VVTEIVYSNIFDRHTHIGHPENADRTKTMLDELQKTSFFNQLNLREPWLLPENILYSVHSDDMINEVRRLSEIGGAWIDADTYVCLDDYNTARLAAGGLLQLCRDILQGRVDNGFALVRPPGHHATRYRSMGFCLFNNAAISAYTLMEQGYRVLIFDHDVHHGNGTQDIFYDNDKVLYQSFHLHPHYPGTGLINEVGVGNGEGFTVNAPLPHGAGESTIRALLDEVFIPIAREFKPDMIIVSSGFDSHHADQLGGLRLTVNFYGELIGSLKNIQPRIACTLEGGYNLRWIGKCFVSIIGELSGNHIDFEDEATETRFAEDVIETLKNKMSEFWDI